MISPQDRLELYRQEKVHLSDELFGPEFPDFKEWDNEFKVNYRMNHITVTTEEADAMMNQIVDSAGLVATGGDVGVATGVVLNANTDALPPASVVVSGDATVVAPVAKKKAKVAKKAVAKTKAKSVKAKTAAKRPAAKAKSTAPKKSDIAREIIKENRKAERKEVIPLLMKKAKLSEAAANTYYYKYKAA